MKWRVMKNRIVASVLCTSMVFGSMVLPSNAAVRDNVGGMDTSVDANAIADNGGTITNGAAGAAQILQNYGAWVDGKLIRGTMVNKAGTTTAASTVTKKRQYCVYYNSRSWIL